MKYVLVIILSTVVQEKHAGYKSMGVGVGAALSIHSIEFSTIEKCNDAYYNIKDITPMEFDFSARCIEK